MLWRSVLEAIAYDYGDVVDNYRNAGIKINTINVTEGGSRDPLWNQIKADVLETQIETYENSGGALLMNSLIASYAVGNVHDLKDRLISHLHLSAHFTPQPKLADFYKKQAAIQKQLLHCLNNKTI